MISIKVIVACFVGTGVSYWPYKINISPIKEVLPLLLTHIHLMGGRGGGEAHFKVAIGECIYLTLGNW
jgi:hypothetical protein